MVQPNSSFDELASLTIANYSSDLRDNVSNNIPLYFWMKELGAVVEESGGTVLLENLDFGDNPTFKWFNGYEELNTTPGEVISSASYDWKEGNVNIIFNRREQGINGSPEKRHDLIKGKTKNGERTLTNNIGAALYYSNTESDGKAIGGLAAAVSVTPTTGIYGGINRATAGNEFWRNQTVDMTDDSITISSTTIQEAMELGWARAARNMDVPTLIPAGDTYWRYFSKSVGDNQRYIRETMSEKAKVSHVGYMFKTAIAFHDPNCAAARMYLLNTDYLKLKVHKDRNMTPLPPRYPAGQAATVIPIDFMGNLVCGNASLQCVLKD